MRLVIREYLSMLREAGELDVLIPDLLLGMDVTPISRAQVGPRQYGVDIAAVGRDPDDGTEKLFFSLLSRVTSTAMLGTVARRRFNNHWTIFATSTSGTTSTRSTGPCRRRSSFAAAGT